MARRPCVTIHIKINVATLLALLVVLFVLINS